MEAHDYWQEMIPAGQPVPRADPRLNFVAGLRDGRRLLLPIRTRPDGHSGLTSLIINQASFVVQQALAEDLAAQLANAGIEIVVGLPTLGLTLASAVAEQLGHGRYVPLGTSRKFWYDEALAVPLTSITTPDQIKRLYLDPRLLPLLQHRRVALIDDVISSGTSIVAGIDLLMRCGIEPAVIGAAMLQSTRWTERSSALPRWQERVLAVFSTPLLTRDGDGPWRQA